METNFQSNNEQPISPQPEDTAPSAGSAPQPASGKKIPTSLVVSIIAVVIVVAGVLVVMAFLKSSPNENEQPFVSGTPLSSDQSYQQLPTPSPEEDSTAAISQQLNDTTVEDVDSQFKEIDTDLNQL